MKRSQIIALAQEVTGAPYIDFFHMQISELEKFAALVAAAEREKMKWDGIHTCGPQCQRPVCVNVRKAVVAEREECAKVCETYNKRQCYNDEDMTVANECAAAIRARGQA